MTRDSRRPSILPQDPIDVTVLQARMWLREAKLNTGGAVCPCCGRITKAYRRPLPVTAAVFTAALVRGGHWHPHDPMDQRSLTFRNGDYAKARLWGLAVQEPMEGQAITTKHSGYWYATLLGVMWVMGRATVPSHVIEHNSRPLGWSDEYWTFQDALQHRGRGQRMGFNYDELMRGVRTELDRMGVVIP